MKTPTLKGAYLTETDLEEILVDPAKHGEDVKVDALETAIEDIEPYVEVGDPTLQSLNSLLTDVMEEDVVVPEMGELPEGKQLAVSENNNEKTASSIYGDEEDREILLDQEPPVLSTCQQGAPMTPLSPMDVIVVKVRGSGIESDDVEDIEGEVVPGLGRVGAPGSPKFDQPSEVLTGELEEQKGMTDPEMERYRELYRDKREDNKGLEEAVSHPGGEFGVGDIVKENFTDYNYKTIIEDVVEENGEIFYIVNLGSPYNTYRGEDFHLVVAKPGPSASMEEREKYQEVLDDVKRQHWYANKDLEEADTVSSTGGPGRQVGGPVLA